MAPKAQSSGGASGSSRYENTKQWPGHERAEAHSKEQRAMVLGTKHGTEGSRRGPRIRVNAEVPRRAEASGGATRGGRFRG